MTFKVDGSSKKYHPLDQERITVNSAECTRCDMVIRSIYHDIIERCKCRNVSVGGGTRFIHHHWKDKSHYRNHTIIYLEGD